MRMLPVVAALTLLLPVRRLPTTDASGRADGPTLVLADSTSVPLELPDGRAVVVATIDGRGPYRIAIETGSPDVLLSPAVVTALALRATGAGEDDSLFRVDSLRIGGAVIRDLPVGRDRALLDIGVDGVLGLIAYRDALLTIDYPAKRPTLSRATLPPPDGVDVLRATRVGPFLGVPVELGAVRETGVIDTQGGIGFQAVDGVAAKLTFVTPPTVVGRARVGGGAPVEVKRGQLAADARLGRHRFVRPSIAIHALPAAIPSRVTIGIGVLRHFALGIDQRTMAVRLIRADTAAITLE